MECLRIVRELGGTRRSIFCQAGISPVVAASYGSSCGGGSVDGAVILITAGEQLSQPESYATRYSFLKGSIPMPIAPSVTLRGIQKAVLAA
jgi:hypothetical protein